MLLWERFSQEAKSVIVDRKTTIEDLMIKSFFGPTGEERAGHCFFFSMATKRAATDDPDGEKISNEVKRTTRRSFSGSDLLKCIICQTEKRDSKNRRRLETLTQCVTFDSSGTLLNAAHIRKDTRALLAIKEDLIAKEILYHRSCYRAYTNEKALDRVL